jgi:PAS domain-containing protein
MAWLKPFSAEYRVVRDDGAVRWVEAHGLPTFTGEGETRTAVSFVGTVADITERKQADERPRTILESITDAFFAVDREWRFTYLNRHASEILALTPAGVSGQSLWEVFPGLRGSDFEALYRSVQREGQMFSFFCALAILIACMGLF